MRCIFRILGMIMFLILLNSCDSPDYEKMRYGRMDIKGATAIGFINSNISTRATAQSSGLYKIDGDGNISAVAIYFSEDAEGNQKRKESEVTLRWADIQEAGKEYIYFSGCVFCDKKGEDIYNLPRYIIVRKSDGKMWDVGKDGLGKAEFFQADNGTLYVAKVNYVTSDKIFKFNFDADNASIEQIVANVEIGMPFSVSSNGVVMGLVNSVGSTGYSYPSVKGKFAWPHSGFQDYSTLFDNWDEEIGTFTDTDGRKVKCHSFKGAVVNFHGQPFLITNFNEFRSYSEKNGYIFPPDNGFPFMKFLRCDKISIGDTPGSAKLDLSNPLTLGNDIETNSFEVRSLLVTSNYILISGKSDKYWIAALNPEKREFKWVTESNQYIDFIEGISYKDCIWSISSWWMADFGAYWFNPKTLESGFVNFKTTLPDYMKWTRYDYVDGKIIYSGVNPADAHTVKLIIDITTGEVITDDQAPEMLFQTLIPLN